MAYLIEEIADRMDSLVKGDPYWESHLSKSSSLTIHLAIFLEPYLSFILEGRKTVESRFSTHRIAPYEKIQRGDVILLKRSGGPILGLCEVGDVWFYRLDPKTWADIRRKFNYSLCVQDSSFWASRKHASFATLIRVQNIRAIKPMACTKQDRRGWVILKNRTKHRRIAEEEWNP